MANYYVSNWGNDENDGLSWETAKKTLAGAKALNPAGIDTVYVNGYFHEQSRIARVVCTPGTVFDGRLLTDFVPDVQLTSLSNAIVENWRHFAPSNRYYREQYNVIVRNLTGNFCYGFSNLLNHEHCVIYNAVLTDIKQNVTSGYQKFNITYAKLGTIKFDSLNYNVAYYGVKDSIFQANFYNWIAPHASPYCLFIGGEFQFSGGGLGFDEVAYAAPIGADDTIKMQNLRDRMAIVYGGSPSDYLVGCKFYSGSLTDILIDPENGDFNLVPYCIAANMSYEGDYIGAKPEGVKANWNTEFNDIINIGTPGYVLNQNIDSTTNSDIIDIGHVRTILNFKALGERAARNGQQINTESNLSSNIYEGSSVLTDGTVYMCIDDIITLDDGATTSRVPWDTFTAVDEGGGAGLGFSTEGVGVVREVYIDERNDQKIQLKTSKTDATLTSATLITSFLYSNPIMVNVDGGGEPTHGDADVGYVEGTAVPLTSRYIKFYIKIKAWNLPARV